MSAIKQTYSDLPCPRCGAKQKISRTWKEKVPTFSGTITVDCSQIVCTDKECQKTFEKNLLEDNKKREAVRVKKEASDLERKTQALLHAAQSRKQKIA